MVGFIPPCGVPIIHTGYPNQCMLAVCGCVVPFANWPWTHISLANPPVETTLVDWPNTVCGLKKFKICLCILTLEGEFTSIRGVTNGIFIQATRLLYLQLGSGD